MGIPLLAIEVLHIEPAKLRIGPFELDFESHHGDGGLLLNRTLAHPTNGRSRFIPLLALNHQFEDLLAIRGDDAANVLLLVIDAHGRRSMLFAFARDDRIEEINDRLRVGLGLDGQFHLRLVLLMVTSCLSNSFRTRRA